MPAKSNILNTKSKHSNTKSKHFQYKSQHFTVHLRVLCVDLTARELGRYEDLAAWDLGVGLDCGRDLVVDGVGVAQRGVETAPTLAQKLGVVAVVIPSLREGRESRVTVV